MAKLSNDERVFLRRVALTLGDRPMTEDNVAAAMRETLEREVEMWLLLKSQDDAGRTLSGTIARAVYHNINAQAGG